MTSAPSAAAAPLASAAGLAAAASGSDARSGTPLLRVHIPEDDLRALHKELEAGAADVGTSLETFLDATGFWDTPHRARALPEAVRSACEGLGPQVDRIAGPGRSAGDRELQLGGTTAARYLRQLRHAGQRARRAEAGWVWLDRDSSSIVTAGTEAAARRAVGAVLDAADWAVGAAGAGGRERRALVLARPPGHHNGCDERIEELERHAWRHGAHGGCIFNETAVAIRHLRARALSPPKRFVVVDLDVHFGDGTAWHFYEDPDVLCISVHLDQSDLHVFPYLKGKAEERGSGPGLGATLNLPLAEGMGDAEAMRLLQDFAWPRAREHAPDVLFLSLGFDGLRGDPSGAGIQYTKAFFEHAVAACCALCPRTVCTLQGGYLPEDMAAAVAAVIPVLAGRPPSQPLATGEVAEGFEALASSIGRALGDRAQWWSVGRSFDYVPEGFDAEEGEEESAAEDA